MDALTLFEIALGGLGLYCVDSFVFRRRPAPLPPGPSPKPLIGNLTDLPPAGEQEWIHWAKHKDLYGPISSITVFGQTLIFIHGQRIAFDLLEKRSALYSSRPRQVFGGEIVGWEHSLALQTYSNRLRIYRKNVHAVIGSKSAVSRFYNDIDVEVRRFLLRVLEEPENLIHHVRNEAGAIILKISHGYAIEPRKRDPLVELADEAMLQFSLSMTPGAWLVDTLPFLRHLPEWLPGMSFKRTAARWRQSVIELTEKPYAFVKQQMARGTNSPSYTSALLEKGDLSPEDEFNVKWSAMSLYGGGADTTVSLLSTFFLAMTVYPEIQRKAQEEIDRVVGNGRLPSFQDREHLPYIGALVKEVLRWHPVGPIGLPHTTTEDDIYEGYFIPKGSVVIASIWWFTHDPETYHDPMTFKPERFLGVDGHAPEMDPHSLVFGFGRRVCPGRDLADASLYVSIAQSLAVFSINKAIEDGKVVEPTVAFTAGLISHPLPFKTSVKPRSEKATALIRTVEEEHPFSSSDAETLRDLKL